MLACRLVLAFQPIGYAVPRQFSGADCSASLAASDTLGYHETSGAPDEAKGTAFGLPRRISA
jgi:hypothetical protein